jgi:hypothetical protein
MVADSARHGVESRSLRGARDLKKSVTIMKACWRVDLISDRLLHVGSINADTADQAINEVAKLFRIEPAQRDKLTATEVQTRREQPL